MTESKTVVVWKWRARNKLNRKWRVLSWRMTEEQAMAWAKAEGREIERIEGSAEERTDLRGDIGPGAFVPVA